MVKKIKQKVNIINVWFRDQYLRLLQLHKFSFMFYVCSFSLFWLWICHWMSRLSPRCHQILDLVFSSVATVWLIFSLDDQFFTGWHIKSFLQILFSRHKRVHHNCRLAAICTNQISAIWSIVIWEREEYVVIMASR